MATLIIGPDDGAVDDRKSMSSTTGRRQRGVRRAGGLRGHAHERVAFVEGSLHARGRSLRSTGARAPSKGREVVR